MSLTRKIYRLKNIVLQSEQKPYSIKYTKKCFKVVQYVDLNYGILLATSMSIITLNLPNTKIFTPIVIVPIKIIKFVICTIVTYKSPYKNDKNRRGHRYSKTNVIMGRALDAPLSCEMR